MDLLISLIAYIDTIAPFLLLVLFFIYKTNLRKELLAFYLFVGAIFLFNLISGLLPQIQLYLHKERNNIIIYHISCIFYFILLLNLFKNIQESFQLKILDIFIALFFAALVVYNFLNWSKASRFNSNTFGLLSFWVIIRCLAYYSQKFLEPAEDDILSSSIFWIISGLFLYFSLSFFIFISYEMLSDKITKEIYQLVYYLWFTQNFILALSCVFYLKGVRCRQL